MSSMSCEQNGVVQRNAKSIFFFSLFKEDFWLLTASPVVKLWSLISLRILTCKDPRLAASMIHWGHGPHNRRFTSLYVYHRNRHIICLELSISAIYICMIVARNVYQVT